MTRRRPHVTHTEPETVPGSIQPVTGFLAEDGTFFRLKCDAEYHSARTELERFLLDQRISPTRVFSLIDGATDNFRRYLDAIKTVEANPNSELRAQDPPTETGSPDQD